MKSVLILLFFLLTNLASAEEKATGEADFQSRLQQVERKLLSRDLNSLEVGRMLEAMTEAGFSLEEQERLAEQLAVDDRLLRQAAFSKIREGIAKGATPQAIIMATEKVRNRMEVATRLATDLRHGNDQTIVEAIADGLAAGLDKERASQLADALKSARANPGEFQELAAETLLYARDMARRRVVAATVVDTLSGFLAQGLSAQEMRQLRQSYSAEGGNKQQQSERRGQNPSRESQAGGQAGERGGNQGDGQGGSGGGRSK